MDPKIDFFLSLLQILDISFDVEIHNQRVLTPTHYPTTIWLDKN